MLGIVDPLRRPLSIPSHFVPYLEKHRIYELFHELTIELVLKKPNDHILYLQQSLHHVARKRDVSRIILLAFPGFDRIKLAEILHRELGLRLIVLEDIQKINNSKIHDPDEIAREMKNIIETGQPYGWVFVDFPRTKKEAYSLQQIGLIPTHVIEILNRTSVKNADNSVINIQYRRFVNPEEIKYRKNIIGIRQVYANSLIQVEAGKRTIEDLGKDCAKLVKIKKHCGAPSVFRIVLIGSPGSGCRTIAKYLSQRFNIIHVDCNYILQQFRLQKSSLARNVCKFENKWETKEQLNVEIHVIEKRIMERDYLNKGWVLTGYPITVNDFKLLNQLSTPPNRIFFVDADGKVCRERLAARDYNTSTTNMQIFVPENEEKNKFDEVFEICEYEKHVRELKNYAEGSALIIDGNLNEKNVREEIEAFLMKPAPGFVPRSQNLEVNYTQDEFDFTEETDLQGVRICQTKSSFHDEV